MAVLPLAAARRSVDPVVRDGPAGLGQLVLAQLLVCFPVVLIQAVQRLVVVEDGLVHHLDAAADRAGLRADAAPAAALVADVVVALGSRDETFVRADRVADLALHAGVELDQRPGRAGRVLHELLVGLPQLDGRDHQALTHLGPVGHLDRRVRVLGPDAGGHRVDLDGVVTLAQLARPELAIRTFPGLGYQAVQRDQAAGHPGHRAHRAVVGAVVVVHPQPAERGLAGQDREVPRVLSAGDPAQQLLRGLARDHEQRAAGSQVEVDGPDAIPGPGLDALGERVVHHAHHRDVLRLVLGHLDPERVHVIGDHRELLGRNPVALGGVPVALDRPTDLVVAAGRLHQLLRDDPREVLLEDTPVGDVNGTDRHPIHPFAHQHRRARRSWSGATNLLSTAVCQVFAAWLAARPGPGPEEAARLPGTGCRVRTCSLLAVVRAPAA